MSPTAFSNVPTCGHERLSLIDMEPRGFKIRPPPPPQELDAFITSNDRLFQTMHMGVAKVDYNRYRLIIDGFVERCLALTMQQLAQLPQVTVTAMHECYGSPLKPPIEALWRIGNVRWTGVRLSHLLEMAGNQLATTESFVWSDGLDRGSFAGIKADLYQKDLPMDKALRPEVLVAYMMNGEPLDRERGGPVRLVVPGWFGTNSTKWLSRLSIQRTRSPGPYTTKFYNEINPKDPAGKERRPVWHIEVNSMITKPSPGEKFEASQISVQGWAWSDSGIAEVEISCDNGKTWLLASVRERSAYEWQRFETTLDLPPGLHSLISRAKCRSGEVQPLSGRRNHVHCVIVEVQKT